MARAAGRVLGAAIGCAALCLPVLAGRVQGIAPEFTRTDFSGKPLRLADYRGKVVLLNFWASWCGPCLVEMPLFASWQRQYGSAGLQVIGVSMDDEAAAAHRYLQRHPVPYPVVMGDAPLAQLYGGVYGLPVTLLIDAEGRIVFRSVGEPAIDALRSRIEAAIRARDADARPAQ
jgi:thiol-disulfide isomerase/thioredoxin